MLFIQIAQKANKISEFFTGHRQSQYSDFATVKLIIFHKVAIALWLIDISANIKTPRTALS